MGPGRKPRRPVFSQRGSFLGFSASRGTYQQQSNTEALPDIVPESRDRSSYGWPDRSLSTPEMSSASPWYEQEVARRLRRISDEFDVATETRMVRYYFVLKLFIHSMSTRVMSFRSTLNNAYFQIN